ncbi:MAG: hypothetical protein HYT76_08850 [Deltaproteobacteria bacterium]|nr:hypothetical protein [Deltaproteobacteria bacterium]
MSGAISYILRPLIQPDPAVKASLWGVARLVGYLGALGLVAKTDFFRSPDDLINGVHKSGLFLKDIFTGSSFSDAASAISEEQYNRRAAQDRDFASLGGTRDVLKPIAATSMIALGVAQTWHELGRWYQTPKAGTPEYTAFVKEHGKRMPNKRMAKAFGVLFMLYLGGRVLADCWGNSRGRKPKEGTCTSNPENFDLHDFNLNLFSSEWAMMAFLSTAFGRSGTIAGNATDVLYHKIGNAVHKKPRSILNRLLGGDFLRTTDYTRVRAEAIQLPKVTKDELMAGTMKGPLAWKIGVAGIALGLIGLGIYSAFNMADDENCNPYKDLFLASVGAAVFGVTAATSFSSNGRKIFDAGTFISRHIFRAPRLSHMLLFTAVGMITTNMINFTLRWIQGFRNIDYYVQNALRTVYGPMPNRIFANAWSSLRTDPFGNIELRLPGQILFYQTVEILTQPKETISQKYRELVQDYRGKDDPEDVRRYRQRLVKKENDLIDVLRGQGISITELERFYRLVKAEKKEEAKKLAIYEVIRSEALAEQYVNILGIQDEYFLTQNELHQQAT